MFKIGLVNQKLQTGERIKNEFLSIWNVENILKITTCYYFPLADDLNFFVLTWVLSWRLGSLLHGSFCRGVLIKAFLSSIEVDVCRVRHYRRERYSMIIQTLCLWKFHNVPEHCSGLQDLPWYTYTKPEVRLFAAESDSKSV